MKVVGLVCPGSLGPLRAGVKPRLAGAPNRAGSPAVGSRQGRQSPRRSPHPRLVCRSSWRGHRGAPVAPTDWLGTSPGMCWRPAVPGAGESGSHGRCCHRDPKGGAGGVCWLPGPHWGQAEAEGQCPSFRSVYLSDRGRLAKGSKLRDQAHFAGQARRAGRP